ncbi:cache domain-containing protein [Pseudomonas sp. 10B1]|uniref:cache domain-containing protein n=1 Tax=unclassified Pseudomonas TaxID=196821 RepID=UPI002AB45F59|nr:MULTISPECIES: cache domain-containing protein [unclassified Pseudomonas]MDY7560622.1 cache domain-containing protein [Pseudomonas sp. AB6]MEA9993378.1 cache domain-containing protein [Pseudomonas sp. AA4]MEB0088372.1 cache domain-containing protein [Pseudomonas sp. RTI1]MEB0124135.1 cache domain-containing protein [Pseudomonas sp. CCC1.2]MEB0152594.1 cache domain-containing protein [Pseudomonas sp. CCC4.3]
MQLKHKIVALGILPLILAVAIISALVIFQNQRLGEQQAQLIEDSILASKRAELKNYVEMAMSSLAPLYKSGRDDEQTKQQVLNELAKLSFGINGYFFVYDHNGRSLMHPRQADLVGRDLWNMTDPHGLLVIQALLKSAQSGDGFQPYAWKKPSTGQVTDKLAYVVMLDRWGWMLGTGIYLEDVEHATRQTREEVARGIHTTMLAIGIVALIAVLLVFACGLTLNASEHRLADKKLQGLTQRIVSLQEEERSRLSRELHDGISQVLVSIKFQFELAGLELEAASGKGPDILRQGIDRLADAIGEVRSISHDLRPSLLDTLGLAAAIAQLVTEFEARSGLTVHYQNNLGDFQLVDGAPVAMFRILQEALTNIERHAQAKNVYIDLGGDSIHVKLSVCDDGVGFKINRLESIQGGIGLRNIRERVDHFDGQFSLTSVPGSSELSVTLPTRPRSSFPPTRVYS